MLLLDSKLNLGVTLMLCYCQIIQMEMDRKKSNTTLEHCSLIQSLKYCSSLLIAKYSVILNCWYSVSSQCPWDNISGFCYFLVSGVPGEIQINNPFIQDSSSEFAVV